MVKRLLWVGPGDVEDMDNMLRRGQVRIINAYPLQNAVMFLCEQDSEADVKKLGEYIEGVRANSIQRQG